MKRRQFLKYTPAAAATPLMLNGLAVRAIAAPLSMSALMNCEDADDRVLVLVKLNGGNDGLNCIVPMDQYDQYSTLRPNISLAESSLINLDTSFSPAEQLGLHPALAPFKSMYDDGKMHLVQGTGYVNTNGSHFKSTDLWLTGGDSTPGMFNLTSGWVGRYLEYEYPTLIANPTAQNPDPLAIQLSDRKQSMLFQTNSEYTSSVNLSGLDPGGYHNLVQGIGTEQHTTLPGGSYGSEISYIQLVEDNTNVYADRISQVFNAGSNAGTYGNNGLAGQLKTVARMLAGGSQTKIFLVDIGNFDTHDGQSVSGSPDTGWHTETLTELANSIQEFHNDLDALGIGDRVMTATFSEFGRRAIENGTYGTDHGTIAPMFVFGNGVQAGVSGANNDLFTLGNGIHLTNQQYDYREVFSTILQDWLGSGDGALAATFYSVYPKLSGIVNGTSIVDPVCYGGAALPISLAYFHARAVDNKVVNLEWKTTAEYDHSHFEIERSSDGQNFEFLIRRDGEGVDTEGPNFYFEKDETPLPGDSFYRLKSVDSNGDFTYSAVEKVRIEHRNIKNLKVYPSPAVFDANLVITSDEVFTANIQIISSAGMVHRTFTREVKRGYNKFNFDVSRLSAGNYFVQFLSKNGKIKENLPLTVLD